MFPTKLHYMGLAANSLCPPTLPILPKGSLSPGLLFLYLIDKNKAFWSFTKLGTPPHLLRYSLNIHQMFIKSGTGDTIAN